jgi:hypothetical protein
VGRVEHETKRYLSVKEGRSQIDEAVAEVCAMCEERRGI